MLHNVSKCIHSICIRVCIKLHVICSSRFSIRCFAVYETYSLIPNTSDGRQAFLYAFYGKVHALVADAIRKGFRFG
ncbi:B7 [Human betaherpesvirus 6B]|uniref:Protein B7 n=3 Tax=Roseolovirus TaxID=40272 RepID=B7_HHV6Z|nr:hypothetical protein HhV6Bgp083 [Human betaherpesvirus 6B]Q69066.1 RecName: Full=Protein B7 [Human herpesvirus 6 strain Z29]ARJ98878.1 B7 [Human betaherpesvirus 6]AAB06362.1 B7 [Human betaherpesvirus 6B]AAC40343.1 CB6RH [Human betaherpesvirus 6B]ARJ98987.1 B7 [Human betaherpesvirus 6]ARJ99210.1 B7 [Human betaherpesvirus 6]